MSKEVIVKLTSDHIKVKGAEYVQDLVRCQDCKYDQTRRCPLYTAKFGYCDEDFCSCGEVRDE